MDREILFYPTLIGGIIIFTYYGFGFVKNKIIQYATSQVLKKLNETQEKQEVLFRPFERSKSAVILYNHGGMNHKVCVPYDRSKSRKMLRKKVFLVRLVSNEVSNENPAEERIEITHKPGIPYLLSAHDMGGTKIIVTKDGNIIQEYSEHEIPKYLV